MIKNRNCINLQEVLYDINDKEIILDFAEQDGYSGIKNDMDHKRKTIKSFTFKTKTLTKVLNDNNAPSNIDYLSLDTEGSELKILKGLDFDKYKINYINVEHNYKEPRRKEIKKLLLSKGYKYLGENKWDDIYILPKIKIIQLSPHHTGLTLLLNLIHVFLSPNESIHWDTKKLIDEYSITKTHNINIVQLIKE